MFFRAVVIDAQTMEHNRTGFMLDPWEEDLGRRTHGIDATKPQEWVQGVWPRFAYDDPTLTEVGKDGEYTLFRRAIDQEREKRWKSGERFQVISYN